MDSNFINKYLDTYCGNDFTVKKNHYLSQRKSRLEYHIVSIKTGHCVFWFNYIADPTEDRYGLQIGRDLNNFISQMSSLPLNLSSRIVGEWIGSRFKISKYGDLEKFLSYEKGKIISINCDE